MLCPEGEIEFAHWLAVFSAVTRTNLAISKQLNDPELSKSVETVRQKRLSKIAIDMFLGFEECEKDEALRNSSSDSDTDSEQSDLGENANLQREMNTSKVLVPSFRHAKDVSCHEWVRRCSRRVEASMLSKMCPSKHCMALIFGMNTLRFGKTWLCTHFLPYRTVWNFLMLLTEMKDSLSRSICRM